jgi:hypothetical protein
MMSTIKEVSIIIAIVLTVAGGISFAMISIQNAGEISSRSYNLLDAIISQNPELKPLVRDALENGYISGSEYDEIIAVLNSKHKKKLIRTVEAKNVDR